MGRLVLVACIACVQVSTASAQKLVVTAPANATGDGASAFDVRVALEPASAIDKAEDLELTTDAGVVGDAKPDGDAAVVYRVTPPRVASATTMTLHATITVGRKTVRARRAVAVSAPPFAQTEVASGGPFEVRAPDRMLLGVHGAADVSIAARDGAPPTIMTNVGALSALEPGDDGRLHATYTPPKAKFPQVAIIAVVAADSADIDWTSIALYGKATVDLKSEANASVVVRVGDTEYGPVRTDRRGKASIAVAAPPGVWKAKTIATDKLGNRKRGSLALGAPPFDRMLAVCPVVDSTLRMLVVDADGSRAERVKVELSASVGALGKAKRVEPGVFAAVYDAPEGATIGDDVSMTAALGSKESDSCRTVMPGEVPSGVELVLARPELVSGGEPIGVTVTLVYPGRLPPLDVDVTLRANLGDVSEPEHSDGGSSTALWTVPASFEGKRRAELVATVESSSATATATLALVAGPAARIVAEPGARVRADGSSTTQIVVRAFDADDNIQPDIEPTANATGSIGPFEVRDDGSHVATYTSFRSSSARSDVVTVTAASGLSARATIALRPLPPRFAASARLGYVTNFAKVSGPMVAVGAGTRLPILRDFLEVGVEVELYRSRTSQMDEVNDQDITTIVDAVPIQATARLSYVLGIATAYVVGRAGIALIDAGVDSAFTGKIVRSETSFAVSGGVGADVAIGPGSAVFEVAMLRAALASDEISGNAGGLQIGAGYRIGF